MQIKNNVVSIDVGTEVCGISYLLMDGTIQGVVIENSSVIYEITKFWQKNGGIVCIEDIRPYQGKLSLQVIETCKFIGELIYRLKNEVGCEYRLITRSEVRKWVFDAFPDVCVGLIDKKIAYLDDYGERKGKKRYRNKDGSLRKASFQYVDDRIVISAMKRLWNIANPKPFKKNKEGFASHSWQALAVGSYYLGNLEKT
jgi:hypothetical protein